MKKSYTRQLFQLFLMIVGILSIFQIVSAQEMDRIERERMKAMLSNIKNEISKNYYDPEFHGINIETRFDQAQARLKEVKTTGQALGVIAQVLMDLTIRIFIFSRLPRISKSSTAGACRYSATRDILRPSNPAAMPKRKA